MKDRCGPVAVATAVSGKYEAVARKKLEGMEAVAAATRAICVDDHDVDTAVKAVIEM